MSARGVGREYPVATAFSLGPDEFFAQQRAINAAHDRSKIERNMITAAREREEDALLELRRQTSVSHLTSFFGFCICRHVIEPHSRELFESTLLLSFLSIF